MYGNGGMYPYWPDNNDECLLFKETKHQNNVLVLQNIQGNPDTTIDCDGNCIHTWKYFA